MGVLVTVTFQQDENTITGRGRIEDRVFSLRAYIMARPIVINYEDGNINPAYVMPFC